MTWQTTRKYLFGLGVVCFALSCFDLVYVFLHPVHAKDYMAQFYEGLPYTQFGVVTSLAAFVLCFFGKRWLKVWTIAPLLLCGFWFLIAGASL